MTNDVESRQEIEKLRNLISRLSAASSQIGASLDLDTVLEETVESARALTGARYGAIATIDETGAPQDFVTSGFTGEEQGQSVEWPGAPRLFEHFRDLAGALMQPDVLAGGRPLGVSPDLLSCRAFLDTPMRHRGVHLGIFYLVEKEGGEAFTREDRDVLVLFASQAATAIANARTHRDEQRARADLEALVDTSPVGVAVYDSRTGNLRSLNREAKRIVENLRMPDRSPEQLIEEITCRGPDGRELALSQWPLAQELGSAGTVRAEEFVLSGPDGRTVTTLINATPILSTDGAVESVVVTMQDLAPLQELEQLRAEFLGMVSHELRAPLTSIKGSAATVLGTSRVLDPAEVRQFFRIIDEQANHMDSLICDLLVAGRIDTGTLSVVPIPSEVGNLVDQARNTFLSGRSRHTVLIDLPPDLPRVMADRNRIVQVLNNLFSNAARHSPESSPIRVAAIRDGVHIAVSVRDEGRGVAPEQLPHLFSKYTGVGGRGVGSGLGLAICKGLVEAHGGRIWAESAGAGQGMGVTFTIPLAEESGTTVRNDSTRTHSSNIAETREPTRILVVDDDPLTLRYVRDALAASDYDPIVTGDHRELPHIVRTEKPALVLLDLILPGTDGIELMERVPELDDLPVIFISGYGRDETIARAFESGAADYIVKPFSATELTARIRATLRRQAEPEPFMLGDLVIDYDRRRVTVAGTRVDLTAIEFELLCVLSLNAGRVSTYDVLLHKIWRGRGLGNSKLVRAFVKKLRRKLGDDSSNPTYIFNERGVGYRLAHPDEL